MSEMLDIVERDRTLGGDDPVADVKLCERFAERMRTALLGGRAVHPAACDRRKETRRSLDCGPLHVMLDAAHAAELLAAAGASRAAMDEARQGRPVTGRTLGARAIADEHAAVERRETRNEFTGEVRIVREDGRDQRALAAPR